ncbi:MAG: hypothetical protein ACYCUM_08635 [Solirubrobacteraceae bacterium]
MSRGSREVCAGGGGRGVRGRVASVCASAALLLAGVAPAATAAPHARVAGSAKVDDAPAATAAPHARVAGSAKVDDIAHLHLVKSYGSLLIEQGQATGSLPGRTTVRMHVGSRVTATFTIATAHGSISGSGSAALKSSGLYASFGGSLSVSNGGGRYAHAHGRGGLFGVIDRRTHAVTVKTSGTLYF